MLILYFRLLRHLADGKWHLRPPRGVGPKTVESCRNHGWIEWKRVVTARTDGMETFVMPLRITPRGRTRYRDELRRRRETLRKHLSR